MSIIGSSGPWLTHNEDYTYNLTCVVFADVTPDVKWIDSDRNVVVSDTAFTVEKAVYKKNVTLKLKFNDLDSSHAGRYSCVSNTTEEVDPPAHNISHWNVTIKRESVKHTSYSYTID